MGAAAITRIASVFRGLAAADVRLGPKCRRHRRASRRYHPGEVPDATRTQTPRRMRQRLVHYGRNLLHQVRLKLWLANVVCGLLPDYGSGVLRARMYRLIGFDVASDAWIMGNLELTTGDVEAFYSRLHISTGAVIGTHVTINLDADVFIGRTVSIGPFVRIYTGTHPLGPGSRRRLDALLAKPVSIEDGSWIGL